MGPDYARGRGNIFFLLTIFFLAIGIGVTAGTYAYAQKHNTIFVAYVGAFILAVVMLVRSLYYYFMKVSIIEGPM